MSDIVFHNCKPDDSALVVSVNGELATPDQLARLVLALNFDEAARQAITKAFDSQK